MASARTILNCESNGFVLPQRLQGEELQCIVKSGCACV